MIYETETYKHDGLEYKIQFRNVDGICSRRHVFLHNGEDDGDWMSISKNWFDRAIRRSPVNRIKP